MVNLPAEPGLTASHGRRRRVRLARRQRHIQVVSSDKLRNTLRDICTPGICSIAPAVVGIEEFHGCRRLEPRFLAERLPASADSRDWKSPEAAQTFSAA